MIDDTRHLLQDESQSQIPPKLHQSLQQNVPEILSHRVVRSHATSWADNLRFLTFDDSDETSDATTALTTASDVKTPIHGQCQPCQARLPVPSGHFCGRHIFNRSNVKDREAELHKYDNPCVHVREHTCEDCQHIPLFPNEGKVTKFRIRRVSRRTNDQASNCDHFIAVSYCWSDDTNRGNANDPPYKVIEEDGSIRDMRVAKNTTDRIVAFARENGFRMIWIDQECIEQDNPCEKELAIQAMDHVYLRAHTSIGLFNAQLQQKELDSFMIPYEAQKDRQFLSRRGRRPFINCHRIDTRQMCDALSKICNDRWNTRAWILQEAFTSNGNMVLLFPRAKEIRVDGWLLICQESSRSELAIRLDAIQDCFELCKPLVRGLLLKDLDDAKSGTPKEGSQRQKTKGGKKQEDGSAKATEVSMTITRMDFFHPEKTKGSDTIFINSLKPRRTCNAAVALTYLQFRGLLRVSDKLAIVANMCEYHVRLNTTEIEKTQNSLATCVLVMSLLNNDLSLLVPQMYRMPESTSLEFPSGKDAEFSWAHSLTRNTGLLQATKWNPFGQLPLDDMSGIVTLSQHGLSTTGLVWGKSHFIELKQLQIKHADAWKNLREAKGPMRGSQRSIKLAHTHLMFKIIRALVSKGEKELANSILNSTSSWKWNSEPRSSTIVESVDQLPSDLRVENRADLFALDPSPDGRYHQSWIIDRVMDQGGLWVWTLVDSFVQPDPGNIADKGEFDRRYENFSHSDMDRIGSVMSSLAGAVAGQNAQGGSESSREQQTSPSFMEVSGAAALIALMLARTTNGMQETRNRRATFDLDADLAEKLLVLTPFQMVLESIPRSPLRGMSISWLTEPVESTDETLEKSAAAKYVTFRVKGMVRGMWRFTLFPTGRYNIV
ncbi:hypothetical protein FDECE_13886 [Fusarium decemcellulare]|nr:hypothetical protein FDECE_13886 [Fusarium decemcellulare]